MEKKYPKTDIKTESQDGFREFMNNMGLDIIIATNLDVLWLAVVGELKTQYGEVRTEKHTTYGSYIHKLIGQKNSGFIDKDLKFYIEQVIQKYKEIESFNCEILTLSRTILSFNLTLYIKDEYITGVVTVGN